jgi:hypothetical protein
MSSLFPELRLALRQSPHATDLAAGVVAVLAIGARSERPALAADVP